jgi:hypothetical protein
VVGVQRCGVDKRPALWREIIGCIRSMSWDLPDLCSHVLPLILARKVKSRSRKGIKTYREREREGEREGGREGERVCERGGFEVTTKLCVMVHGGMFRALHRSHM